MWVKKRVDFEAIGEKARKDRKSISTTVENRVTKETVDLCLRELLQFSEIRKEIGH